MKARAVLFHGPGKTLEVVQTEVPEPRGAEVLVRVSCCTLCRSDLHTHAGRRQEPTPTILGHEVVGTLAAFGPEARRTDYRGVPTEVGERITWAVVVGCGECFFCAQQLLQKCVRLYKYGHVKAERERATGGGLAEYLLLKAGTAWFRVPEGLTDWVAAPANCATATAAAILRQAGSVEGKRVLILGAGMLGVTACAMARARDAREVIVSDPDEANRERARAFGASMVVGIEKEALAGCLAERTEGRGADVVLELAGAAEAVQTALDSVRTGGTVILAGTVAPTGGLMLEPEGLVRRMLTIRGVHNYHPDDLGEALTFLAGAGRVFPFESLVQGGYTLEEVEQAFAQAHAHPGIRIAVMPGGPSVRVADRTREEGSMMLKEGDKILVAHRRLFAKDEVRFFVARVVAYESGVVKATGHSYVRDMLSGQVIEKAEERTKILSLASGTLMVYQLPETVMLEALKFVLEGNRLMLIDEKGFSMNLAEHMRAGRT